MLHGDWNCCQTKCASLLVTFILLANANLAYSRKTNIYNWADATSKYEKLIWLPVGLFGLLKRLRWQHPHGAWLQARRRDVAAGVHSTALQQRVSYTIIFPLGHIKLRRSSSRGDSGSKRSLLFAPRTIHCQHRNDKRLCARDLIRWNKDNLLFW